MCFGKKSKPTPGDALGPRMRSAPTGLPPPYSDPQDRLPASAQPPMTVDDGKADPFIAGNADSFIAGNAQFQPGYPSGPYSQQQPGYSSTAYPQQQPGYPAAAYPQQQPGYPSAAYPQQQPGYPSTPYSQQQPGYPSAPYSQQQPGYAEQPVISEILPSSFRVHPAPDPYATLQRFDTVFLIDDSGSMHGRNWSQTASALASVVPICTEYDSDGVDIHFLNSPISQQHVRKAEEVYNLFSRVAPHGATPTGRRLGVLLEHYMHAFRNNRNIKPMNVICITDGEPTDPATLERTIVKVARELDQLKAKERQVGVQFFQVGDDHAATQALEELDNCLVEEHGVRDMVDTVSWKDLNGALTGEGILKAVMGAVDGGLDRKRKLR